MNLLPLFSKKHISSSDEELMALVIKGNEKAFNELYKRYSKNIIYFFYQRLYHDNEKAQDFLQDLFLKVLEKADLYDRDKKFKIWLYAIATNMCKNEYRRLAVRGVKVSDFDFDEIMQELSTLQLGDKFDKDLFNKLLTNELQKLNNDHSLAFVLRYKQHLSIKEISQVMGCAEGTIKSRLFYTIKNLSEKLDIFNPHKI